MRVSEIPMLTHVYKKGKTNIAIRTCGRPIRPMQPLGQHNALTAAIGAN